MFTVPSGVDSAGISTVPKLFFGARRKVSVMSARGLQPKATSSGIVVTFPPRTKATPSRKSASRFCET